jgi:hypothetical protein
LHFLVPFPRDLFTEDIKVHRSSSQNVRRTDLSPDTPSTSESEPLGQDGVEQLVIALTHTVYSVIVGGSSETD